MCNSSATHGIVAQMCLGCDVLKLVCLQGRRLELFFLQFEFGACSPFMSSDALSHCKQESFTGKRKKDCKQKTLSL